VTVSYELIPEDVDAIHNVVGKTAVELVEVIETSTRKPGDAAAKERQPDVSRLLADGDAGDDLPRQAVGLGPRPPSAILIEREAALGSNPETISICPDGENVIIRQPALLGIERLPVSVDVRFALEFGRSYSHRETQNQQEDNRSNHGEPTNAHAADNTKVDFADHPPSSRDGCSTNPARETPDPLWGRRLA
jgi:hypothetical protein